ncbi:hypothetical protein V6N13_106825 [Hibiscus sabdariffa]
MPFGWIHVVFVGFVSFWVMIIDYGFDVVHYFDYLHKVDRNLEEGLKICCFIVMETGDEEGRVFQSLATSSAFLRPSLSIGHFYLCLPEVQNCKVVYLHQNVVTCGNLEIVFSPMSGLKKPFIPFLYLGKYLAAKRMCFR